MDKRITEVIEEVCDNICTNYCKYPNEYNAEDHDGIQLWDSDICENCPLNKLS